MNALHPLIARLSEITGRPVLNAETLEAFLAERGNTVLFCGGDPVRYPECLDVAVVLPELLAAFPELGHAAVAGPEVWERMQADYGIQTWPALIFLRDGRYVGTIAGMQDWQVYLERVAELRNAPVRRPPSVGVLVAASVEHACH
jgi:hydrogenase-1 operon protein HyaE